MRAVLKSVHASRVKERAPCSDSDSECMHASRVKERASHVSIEPGRFSVEFTTMWETTFARNSHAGLGRPVYEPNTCVSMVKSSFGEHTIGRGYFSQMLFSTWLAYTPTRLACTLF
jgi:hypothetical protein